MPHSQGRSLDLLTVACVYRPSKDYTDEYVYRLHAGVREHLFLHDRFVCLTDRELPGIECVPFERNWPGWWSKLELWRPGLFTGQVAYFDLDTIIRRDICDIFNTRREFASLTNWSKPHRLASGVMTWQASDKLTPLYESFQLSRDAPRYSLSMERWGDQGWIQDTLPVPFESLNELHPGRIVSYKNHVRAQGAVPSSASIVAFHGKPRPHQVNWELPSGVY